jgi:hypothetical protein
MLQSMASCASLRDLPASADFSRLNTRDLFWPTRKTACREISYGAHVPIRGHILRRHANPLRLCSVAVGEGNHQYSSHLGRYGFTSPSLVKEGILQPLRRSRNEYAYRMDSTIVLSRVWK